MIEPRLVAARVALCCISLVAIDAAQAQRNMPKHLDLARDFVKNLAPAATEYRHKDTVVRWRGVDGAPSNEARTDCSGFLDALLERAYGLTRDDFKKWTGRARPLANTYHAVIEQGKGFIKIASVKEVRPGDILAVRYPTGAEDTGHVMLVNSAPSRRTATPPVQTGTEQWEVKVIDCSRSGHGKTDTRHQSDGSFSGGVGEGTFRLYSDKAGTIVGYTWSTVAKSDYRSQQDRPVAVGRLVPNLRAAIR
jgi:hypothetical protein